MNVIDPTFRVVFLAPRAVVQFSPAVIDLGDIADISAILAEKRLLIDLSAGYLESLEIGRFDIGVLGQDRGSDGTGDIVMGRNDYLFTQNRLERGDDSLVPGNATLKENSISYLFEANYLVQVVMHDPESQAGHYLVLLGSALFESDEIRFHENGTALSA
jgi:hypothetical protein